MVVRSLSNTYLSLESAGRDIVAIVQNECVRVDKDSGAAELGLLISLHSKLQVNAYIILIIHDKTAAPVQGNCIAPVMIGLD